MLEDSDDEEEVPSSDSEPEDTEEVQRKDRAVHHMTDATVFQACGGMILRKFVPTGKLERLAQQEAQYQAQKRASEGGSAEQPRLLETIVAENERAKREKKKATRKDQKELSHKRSRDDQSDGDSPPRKKAKKEDTPKSEQADQERKERKKVRREK